MKFQIVAGVVLMMALSSCGTRFNPANWGWFSGEPKQESLAPSDGYADKTDRRPLVDQVTSLSVAPTSGGVIVTAVGLPPTQGYWEADLVSTYTTVTGKPAAKDGVMWLEFKAIGPLSPRQAGTPRSRDIVAATFLSNQELAGAQRIVVVGARNERASRR